MTRGGATLVVAVAALASWSCFSDRSDLAAPGACDDPQQQVTVTIRDFRFDPAEVCVAAGGTVRWVNEGNEIHTSNNAGPSPEWASGFLAPGQQYTAAFPEAGTFDYLCLPHPFMTGVVVVK